MSVQYLDMFIFFCESQFTERTMLLNHGINSEKYMQALMSSRRLEPEWVGFHHKKHNHQSYAQFVSLDVHIEIVRVHVISNG